MIPVIAHIYGPITIHSYGLAMAVSIMIFSWLFLRHPRRSGIISTEQFYNLLTICTIAGIVGARLMYILSTEQPMTLWQMLAITQGGLSFLGGLIAIIITVPLYLRSQSISLLPLLDLAALYAPIIYAFSRIGCFLAGCCYGIASSHPCAITYTHPESLAPLGVPLIPTQLISASLGLILFVILSTVSKKIVKRPGLMLGCYLILASIERFMIDFWRADRILVFPKYLWLPTYSVDQWVAFATATAAFIFLLVRCKQAQNRKATYERNKIS